MIRTVHSRIVKRAVALATAAAIAVTAFETAHAAPLPVYSGITQDQTALPVIEAKVKRRRVVRTYRNRNVGIGAAAAFGALAIGGASGFDPGAPFFSGMGCAFVECSVALIPVSVLLVLSTRFAATASHVFVGALAAASGGALALHLHCSNGTIAHIAAFHLLPAVVLGAVAVVIRSKLRTRTLVP